MPRHTDDTERERARLIRKIGRHEHGKYPPHSRQRRAHLKVLRKMNTRDLKRLARMGDKIDGKNL